MTDWTPEAIERRMRERAVEPESSPVEPKPAPARMPLGPSPVVVTDIHMPFGSMVAFMVKWAIAAIPALLILAVIWLVSITFLGGIIKGIR